MFDHPCNEPHLKNVKHVRKVNPLVTFIFGKRLGSTLRDDSGAPKSGSWPPPRAALVATTTMATCSSYEWSGCYPCSIEIDKSSRWRDFIRHLDFWSSPGKKKNISFLQSRPHPHEVWIAYGSCEMLNHSLTYRHPWLWFFTPIARQEILRTNKNPLELKGVTFSEPSFWVSMLFYGMVPLLHLSSSSVC